MGPDAMIFCFCMLSFKPAFSLSSFTLIKRLFSSSSTSAIRVVSSAYMTLLLFLPEILILACDSSILVFHVVYSAHKLNKQGDSIQPCHTPFPILNQSVIPCLVLTFASWHAYRFLRKHVRCCVCGGVCVHTYLILFTNCSRGVEPCLTHNNIQLTFAYHIISSAPSGRNKQ